MEARLKRSIIEQRIERLKAHIENVGDSEGFRRELERAEAELAQLEQQKD